MFRFRPGISCVIAILIAAGVVLFNRGASAAPVSVVPAGESLYEVDTRGKPVPNWSGGALVVLESIAGVAPPFFTLFDKQGQRISALTFPIPAAAHTTVRHFTRGADGSIALCGSVVDREGRGTGYLGWTSADGSTIQIVRTTRYLAAKVAFASDGTVWTAGIEERDFSAPVFRRFDRTGKMLGAFVAGTEFRSSASLLSPASVFAAIGDRAVWYSRREAELVEVSPDGDVRRIQGILLPDGEAEGGFAVTDEGEIFLSSRGRSSASIWRLDRNRRAWVPVFRDDRPGQTPRPFVYLYGAEGNTLIARDNEGRYLKYFTIQ